MTEVRLPRMMKIEQRLYSRRVSDLEEAIRHGWDASRIARSISSGDRVAITVGSRGIENIASITTSVVRLVKERRGRPFILPAMGSHGGATAAGQTALLRALGVTPESVGAPIRAAMAAVQVGTTRSGAAVYASREALDADGLILMNRIKQHTDFTGGCESGLSKMLAIGVGKRKGAIAMHSRRSVSLREDVPEAAHILLERLPVLGALAILENGHHQTADIVGVPTGVMLAREKVLIRRVRRNAARIPFRELDLLIVDRIGKDISGVGFDTHVIGRRMIWGETEFEEANIGVIALRDLTPESRGNALGIGLADLVTERLLRKIDWATVRTNVLHTGFLNRAKLPIVLRNDRELMEAAMTALGAPDPKRVRAVRLADTLTLGRMWISEGLLGEARRHPRVTVLGDPRELRFDRRGNFSTHSAPS